MKRILLFISLLILPIIAKGEIGTIPFIPEEFEIEIYQYPHMVLIENPESQQLDTYFTFTNNEASYQIRYAFFKQTIMDDPNIKIPFLMMTLPITLNVAGYEINNFSNFDDTDVKNEFNGDFGSTIFIQNPKSDFGLGYNYILMSFFYKNNQGFIVQSILSNDLEIFQSQNFMDIFHSFKFKN